MNIKVDAGQTVSRNLKMIVGMATQSLTVNGKPQTGAPSPPPPLPAMTGNPIALPQRISAGVIQGLAISQPQPIYPDEAKAQHIQGVVVLRARISKEGAIKDLQLISGPPALVVSAIDAVRQWKYKPYTVDGDATEVVTIINVNYTLAGDPAPTAPASGAPAEQHPATPPVLVYKVDAEFSAEARELKIGGVVLVKALVNLQGVAENIQVVRGIGHGLDEKAVEAVKQYRFKPATENGNPVPREVNIEVDFKITDSPDAAAPQAQARIVIARPPDADLYGRGVNAINDGWYAQGRQVLQTLLSTYPDSPFAQRARLAIADSLNKQKSAAPNH
jgi:TonB family protein